MARKLTIDEVRSGFAKRGWKLTSTEYQGSQKKLDVVCDQGHETTITWNNFQRGQGCNVCAGNQKFDLEEVKKQFAEMGFEFLDTEYVNNNVPVRCRCVCGNVTKMPLATVKQGSHCIKCKPKKIAIKNTIKKEVIEEFCKSQGFEYIDHWVEKKDKQGKPVARSRVKYKCKCGNEVEAVWWNLKRHPGCWECGKKKKSGDKCYMWNPDRDQVALNKKIQKRCWNLVGRVLANFDQEKDAKKEKILGYSVESLTKHIQTHPLFNPNIEYHIDHIFPVNLFVKRGINDMKLINKLTNLRPLHDSINLSKGARTYEPAFDIWLADPTQNAEEVIWRCVKRDFELANLNAELIDPVIAQNSGEYQKQHYLNAGKMFVFPHEWIRRKEQIIHRCQVLGNVPGIKIGARKCQIEQIDRKQVRAFCDEYHVQGTNKLCKVGFGLFYDKMLVGVLSLAKHHRGGDQLILDRLCFRAGYHVSGGSEKLLKVAKEWAKQQGHDSIVTFSDRRYTSGDVYQRLNFVQDRSYDCDYSYVLKTDPSVYYSKQSQSKKASKCPDGFTEWQWATERGLQRIWDCGKDRWTLRF